MYIGLAVTFNNIILSVISVLPVVFSFDTTESKFDSNEFTFDEE